MYGPLEMSDEFDQESFIFEIELVPFKCLFWNSNDSVLKLMISTTSDIFYEKIG